MNKFPYVTNPNRQKPEVLDNPKNRLFRYFDFTLFHNKMRCGILLALALLIQAKLTAQTTDNQNDCGFGLAPQVVEPTCPNSNDGSILINILSPVTNLLYNWEKNGQPLNIPIVSNIAQDLSPGLYRVIVRGITCADTLRFKLGPEPLIANVLDTAICGIRGAVNLLGSVRGGNGDFKVVSARSIYGNPLNCDNCPTAAVNVDRTSLFSVVLQDRKGCETSREVFVQVYDSLITQREVVVDETCTENGSITMRTSGGSGEYRYMLNNDNLIREQPTFKGLRGNTDYRIMVVDQRARGCRTVDTVRVGYDPQFTPVTVAKEDVSCYGDRNGVINIQPSADGNITGYSLNSLDATTQEEPVFQNLRPGEYRVFVKEGPDCYMAYPATIEEPDPLTFDTVNVTDPNCPGDPGGSAQFRASGGNGGYQYSLDGRNFQENNFFANLTAGNYKVVVKDQEECLESEVFTVSDPEAPPVGANVTASCPGDSSGAIVIVEGGKLLYGDYLFSLDSINWQQQNFFEGLAPGQYTIFIWYPDGCIYKVTAIVPEVNAPGVFFRIQNESCPESADGSIVVEITNGNTDAYLYSIDNQTYTTKNSFKNLGAGTYGLYLRDSLDCVYEYQFEIGEPSAPAITIQKQDISCTGGNDGQIRIQTQGGTTPFTYAVNNANFKVDNTFTGLRAATHTALVRDANGCIHAEEFVLNEPAAIEVNFTIEHETCNNQNGVLVGFPSGGASPYRYLWSTGDTTAVNTQLPAGAYTLTVTDKNNCKQSFQAHVENIPGPLVFGDITEVPCYGSATGAIELNVVGGNEPLSYNWSNGLRSPGIYNLKAGEYTVTVTDSNKCIHSKTFNLYEPAPIELSSETGESGGGWFINLIVEGGVAPYRYTWSNGKTTEDVFNLAPDTYTVTVTDRENCSQSLTITVGTTHTTDPEWASYINIFPNPTHGKLTIVIDSPNLAESSITVFNVIGQIVLPKQKFSEKRMELDLSRLPAAVYLLQIEREKAIFYRKIVKE